MHVWAITLFSNKSRVAKLTDLASEMWGIIKISNQNNTDCFNSSATGLCSLIPNSSVACKTWTHVHKKKCYCIFWNMINVKLADPMINQKQTNKQIKWLNSQPKGQKFGGVTRIPLFVPNQLCFPAEELYSQEKKQSHLKMSLHLTGQGTTQKMKVNNKNSCRIMIITITKIIYLYIRQKNVLSTNLWNKNKSPKIKKSHILEI